MAACMRHRGPDDQGTSRSADGHVAFGHQRLAIIDLSQAGHQPMRDPSGRYTVVLNGEIYNYVAVRDSLQSAGVRFETATDTEVLLEAYRAWGTECLERLNGMFAFAIHDAAAGTVFCARDRAGEKPFYYRHHAGRLEFASELKALLSLPGVSREVDVSAFHHYLAYGHVGGADCIIRGVLKLPAAHAMLYEVSTDALRVWRYWELPHPESTGVDDEELLTELVRLLSDSVRLRLVADVPVGILLSGGVDSSLVTAIAAQYSETPVRTFTVVFPGHKTFDEGPFARMVASHFGTDHTELVADDPAADLLPALARQFDEPLADHSIIPTFLVSRLIRPHATVALGGDGGDELFGGYPHYSLLQRAESLRPYVPRILRSGIAAAGSRLPIGTRGRNHLVGFGGDLGDSLSRINLIFDAQTRRALIGEGPGRARSPEHRKRAMCEPGLSALQVATRLDFATTLVDDYLVKVDRASMLCSLEVRAPFLDHRLMEFAFGRLPDGLRAAGGERKILLRTLGERILPRELRLRRKQGFSLPLASWFAGPWGRYVDSILLDGSSPTFSPMVVRTLFNGLRRGRPNENRLFTLLMFELWRREYDAILPGDAGRGREDLAS